MKRNTFVVVVLVALILVGTFGGWVVGRWSALRSESMRETCPEAEELRWIQRANLREDFRQHVVGEGDIRFLSVFGLGFSTEFPGLEDTPEMHALVREYGARRLKCCNDVPNCIEQMQLQERIFDYAAHYNNMVLGYSERPK